MIPGDTWDRGVDLVAVDRAVSGYRPLPALTAEERLRAAQVMVERGRTLAAAAEALEITVQQINRWRAKGLL